MTTTASGIVIPEYDKLETLFNRDPQDMKHIIPWDYRLEEFALINRWLITEKIDGTNVRVIYQDGHVRFGGKTDNAQMPIPLLDTLREMFDAEKFHFAFPPSDEDINLRITPTVVLFGEGYGAKIQKGGGNYRSTPGFRLFDVAVWGDDGRGGEQFWWLKWSDVVDVARKLDIDIVPGYGIGDLAFAFQQLSVKSHVAWAEGGTTWRKEGIVCRTDPPLFTRRGKRLIWKLKLRDLPVDMDNVTDADILQIFGAPRR